MGSSPASAECLHALLREREFEIVGVVTQPDRPTGRGKVMSPCALAKYAADYFIDCYEVVRELVEDGIVKSGATVGEGGLLTTLRTMASSTGADISVGDICRAYSELPLRVLFSEVPGVILQIADLDYDYIDAELLLQYVAYFPLGHPVPGSTAVTVLSSEDSGIHGILKSLLNTLEGED